ncbi:PREDICTED: protein LAZ1-like isoform X2 [Ipomoea nil]|uniref:protein LAZ1-like isoform X2 n=1 Tax=Ipomoea nil TaxID=35883 RepID=UPI000901A72F|nr:PREDICTED: protein LAZ1-like isoform X2 [Ipomoea nil]
MSILLWFSCSVCVLVESSNQCYIEILRDGYESFAMYCFERYLIACLGGEDRAIRFMQRQGRESSKAPLLDHDHEKGIIKHPFPMNYLFKPWPLMSIVKETSSGIVA